MEHAAAPKKPHIQFCLEKPFPMFLDLSYKKYDVVFLIFCFSMIWYIHTVQM
mgnify:CR=1 FL=1